MLAGELQHPGQLLRLLCCRRSRHVAAVALLLALLLAGD